MSAHFHVHVGPYVRVVTATAVAPTSMRTCMNPSCPKHAKRSNAKFCDECGTRVEQATVLGARRKSVRDILTGAFEDRFYVPGEPRRPDVELLVPNVKGPRPFAVSDADGSEKNLMKADLRGEIEWLESTFPNELTVLRGTFSDVQVCWGVVGYWS